PPPPAPHPFPTRRSSDLLAPLAHHRHHGLGADFLRRVGLAADQHDARGEALEIPLPRRAAGLVEVVEVEHDVAVLAAVRAEVAQDRKSTRLNSSHVKISY